MTSLRQRIVETLPSLRRYACALSGDRRTGDEIIRVALMVLAEDPRHVRADADLRFQLYRLFHRVFDVVIAPAAPSQEDAAEMDPYHEVKLGLISLPLMSRKLLLLVTMEGFSLERAAELLDLPVREARLRLVRARMQFSCTSSPAVARGMERTLERLAA